jgi:hypothetical protein
VLLEAQGGPGFGLGKRQLTTDGQARRGDAVRQAKIELLEMRDGRICRTTTTPPPHFRQPMCAVLIACHAFVQQQVTLSPS